MAKSAATTASNAASNMLDVLIIGAGWSGLSAALKLSQAGRKVAVLEARERIGGRAFTHTWSDKTDVNDTSRTVASPGAGDYWCDFGCSWMHGYLEGSPLKGLTDKYSIPVTIPSPRETVVVGEQGPLPQPLSQKLTGNLAKAQEAAKAAAHDETASPPEASTSLADFFYSDNSPLFAGLESESEKKAARGVARMLHIPLGIELEKASLRWHGFEHAFAGTDAAPKGGFTTIINKLVDEITSLGTSIHTSQEVQSVRDEHQSSNGVKITTKQGREFTARTALVTIPIAVLKKTADGLFEPSLPERRLETIKRVSVGNLNKVLLHYDRPWWNSKTGTFLVLPSSAPAPSSVKSDAEKKLWELYSSTTLIVSSLASEEGSSAAVGKGASNSLLVMVGGEAGKQLEAYERVDAGNALHAYLTARIDGGSSEANAEPPKHIFYSRWAKQAFTGGATTSPVSTANGTSPLDFEALSRPVWNGRLGFAGEHTEINHRGSAAGAYVSGEREADRLLAYLDKLYPRTANKL